MTEAPRPRRAFNPDDDVPSREPMSSPADDPEATVERPDLGLLTATSLKPVPFFALRAPAVRLVAGWYQFLDAIGR